MVRYTYNKLVKVRRLFNELSAHDIQRTSISYNPIGLENDKIKKLIISSDNDPTTIVNEHQNVPDKIINFQAEYEKALTTDYQLLVIAKSIGLVPITDEERGRGTIII